MLSAVGLVVGIPVALVVLAMLAVAIAEGRKAYWDYKVAELCSKEGGIKVFHTVELSAEDYSKLLNPFQQFDLRPEQVARPADRYVYSSTTEYVVRNGLEVRKLITRVLDRSGPVVLAEKIEFARVGGDLIPLDQRSSFSCPKSRESFFEKPFVKR